MFAVNSGQIRRFMLLIFTEKTWAAKSESEVLKKLIYLINCYKIDAKFQFVTISEIVKKIKNKSNTINT